MRVRNPQLALTVSAVYRAVELRAKTEAQFAIQYQKMNAEGGNFVPDMWGPGRNINYLLQVQPNPSSAASLIEQVVIRRCSSVMPSYISSAMSLASHAPCGWQSVAVTTR